MKRRNFLLSIPLIGAAVKAVANGGQNGKGIIPQLEENNPSVFNAKILKGRLDDILRKYPLTERESYPVHTGIVKSVKKLGYKKYQVDVEMVHSKTLILNGVAFSKGAYGVIREHKIIAHRLHQIIISTAKKKNQIDIGDKMVLSYTAYPEA